MYQDIGELLGIELPADLGPNFGLDQVKGGNYDLVFPLLLTGLVKAGAGSLFIRGDRGRLAVFVAADDEPDEGFAAYYGEIEEYEAVERSVLACCGLDICEDLEVNWFGSFKAVAGGREVNVKVTAVESGLFLQLT